MCTSRFKLKKSKSRRSLNKDAALSFLEKLPILDFLRVESHFHQMFYNNLNVRIENVKEK